MSDDTVEPDVLVEQRGVLVLLTLNRPAALNALTHGMVRTIAHTLERVRDDASVQTVAIRGAGTRGLCAGGDIVSLYRQATAGNTRDAAQFWADEYRLNHLIATYPKPYVAIQDGIVLGGGVGISAHGSHRIVTETTRLGFPEVSIGFVPDVGASWLLSRAPQELATLVALTGEHVGVSDAIRLGLADTFVPREHTATLLEHLEHVSADEAVAKVARPAPEPQQQHTPQVEAAFGANSVQEIFTALRRLGDSGQSTLSTLHEKSPTSLAVTYEMLRRAAQLESLAECLRMEYRIALHAHASHDFVEGVRAQVIDKDRAPLWDPNSLDVISDELLETYFTSPTIGDLAIAGTYE